MRIKILGRTDQLTGKCKKTRKGLGMREVGDQLVIDAARYRNHADCKSLVCFVYDPDGFIQNPEGLQGDLERNSSDEFKILIYVCP